MAALLSSLTPEHCLRRYPDFNFTVTSLWVRQFKKSLGYDAHVVEDDSYVPNIFLSCLRDGDFRVFQELNIALDQLIHTTQVYEFLLPVAVGDEIKTQTEVTKVRAKLNTENPFVALEVSSSYIRGDKVVAAARGTLFVREYST